MRVKVNEVVRTHVAIPTFCLVVVPLGFIALEPEVIPDHPPLAMTMPFVPGAILQRVRLSTRGFTQICAGNFSIEPSRALSES